jgi:L-rhamnose isomerase
MEAVLIFESNMGKHLSIYPLTARSVNYMAFNSTLVQQAYTVAQQRYAEVGVDAQKALDALAGISISMHCWQGDDVGGFEPRRESQDGQPALGGGLAVTGNYPGKATNVEQLRADLEKAYSLIPGRHRLNLHASYGEFSGKFVDRNEIRIEHFQGWIDWAKERGLGLDFNPTCFSHPLAEDGFTLSHPDTGIRQFWIEHCMAAREIGAAMGKRLSREQGLSAPTITNVWIPDGSKDSPADRFSPRQRLADSLDQIFSKPLPAAYHRDAVESKLFGIGSESYVVGSHEFYLGYAVRNKKVLCLDAGHFHPTESVADKISSVLLNVPEILLHVSRGVRWDSDHVVILDDALNAICQEVIRNDFLHRTHIGLDFFDASINRIAAWVIGTRNTLKALLIALLEPPELRESEERGDWTGRLAWMEENKSLPWQAVWDYYCLASDVPVAAQWLDVVRDYERQVLSRR